MKIQVRNLVKIFGKNPQRGLAMLQKGIPKEQILREAKLTVGVADVSLDIAEGEIFVVMGLSGSGKSTLLRCLNRLHEPTKGEILVDGEDITKMSVADIRLLRRRKMGMVFQGFALFPNRTILDNVGFGLEIKGVSKEERRKKAAEVISAVGLDGYELSYPRALSGGMQQRVGLARALASDPDILLMDEPFSALDPLIRKEMQGELLKLQTTMNKTIVFITHDLDEALSLGDSITIMKDGEVVQIGSAEDILNHPESEYVARFTEDVDRTKILTAESVMEKPHAVAIHGKDGIQTVLHKIKQHKIANIILVDRNHRFLGVLHPDSLLAGREEKVDLLKLADVNVPKAHKSTPIRELLEVASDTKCPLAVVDDGEKLLGIIVRGSMLAALARRGDI